jgi:hypothetical protein
MLDQMKISSTTAGGAYTSAIAQRFALGCYSGYKNHVLISFQHYMSVYENPETTAGNRRIHRSSSVVPVKTPLKPL